MKKSSVTCDRKTNIYQLRQPIQDFVDERDWRKYHNPKDLAISIAIEAAELMELFQWVSERKVEKVLEDAERFTRLEEELADIIILCFNLANALDVDVAKAVTKKVEKNRAKYPVDLVTGNCKKYTQLKDARLG
jgi:dCTP diphosphatase